MITPDPVTEPTPVTLEPVPTAVVRHRGITMADLAPLFDAAYPAIAASGAPLAGPPFALYHGDPATSFDLELGFPLTDPLAESVPGEVTIEPSWLPEGDALLVTHYGSYENLPEAWGRLFTAAGHDVGPSTSFFEVYVTDPTPDTDPATLRTDLYLLGGTSG